VAEVKEYLGVLCEDSSAAKYFSKGVLKRVRRIGFDTRARVK
jgi:hypothetical protein